MTEKERNLLSAFDEEGFSGGYDSETIFFIIPNSEEKLEQARDILTEHDIIDWGVRESQTTTVIIIDKGMHGG